MIRTCGRRTGFVVLAGCLSLGITAAAAAAPAHTTVGLAKGSDYAETVRQAVAFAGGLSDIVKPGSTVFIKPNIVAPVESGIGHITDYRVVQEVVNLVRKAGAKRIIIGEHTNPDNTEMALATSGIGDIKGVEFLDTNTSVADSYTIKAPKSLTGLTWSVPKAWVDADVVISVPVLKTHNIAGVTLSLKNVGIGIPPIRVYDGGAGWKQQLHSISVPKTIADICQIRKIDFAIIDAMVAGEGEGPGNPTPRTMNVIIAGRDPVAVDTIGSTVMGIDPRLITHISYSEAVGLGTMDRSLIDLKGASLAVCQKDLSRASEANYPYKMTTYAQDLPAGFVLDGDTAEWQGMHTEAMSAKSAKDCSASLKMGYKDGNLYVAGDVIDDKVVAGKDAVSIYVSLKSPFEPDRNDSRDRHDPKLDFDLTAAVPKSAGEVVLKDGDGREMGSAVFSLTSTGYAFEATIPLKSANLSLAFGEEFWVDFGIADADGTGSPVTTYWAGPGNKKSNPTTLGRAICLAQ